MIVCENLVKIYKQTGIDVLALQGLDLTVRDGEMIGIVGESGSGKSTLMNILGGLDRPSAGKALVNDMDLLQLDDRQLDVYRRKQVGFLWQQTSRNLIPWLSAIENIRFPMIKKEDDQTRAKELIEMVGLRHRAQHYPRELSGGEQQRISIALTLANNPSLLLADEPTGELDTETSQVIYQLLQDVNKSFGTTVIIVSHDPDIAKVVQRVVKIRDGKTSTETLGSMEEEAEQPRDELLMLDSAGRVQIPRFALERLSIASRVSIDVTDEQIILGPVDGHRRTQPITQAEDSDIFLEEDALGEQTRKPSFLKRLFKKRSNV